MQKILNNKLFKFSCLLIIVVGYFLYLKQSYGFETSGIIIAVTWSFFVLCTPVADAGILIDFPMRLLFKFKMIYTEIFVWVTALFIAIYFITSLPQIFDTTYILQMYKKILLTPFPYWSVIIICSIGTFLTIFFADEMYEYIFNRKNINKNELKKIFYIVVFYAIIIILYIKIITWLNIEIN